MSVESRVRTAESVDHAARSEASSSGRFRTWTVTIAICAIVLTTMYGFAFWHEARSEASRVINTAPPAVGQPADATAPQSPKQ